MPSTKLFALAAAASTASAAFQGFNYGATFGDGTLKVYSDYESHFKAAQGLEGTDGKFNSARLYTMIQGNTDNEPNQAIPAAIKTKTSILFGLWASGGQEGFDAEVSALQKTIDQYCDQLDGLVAGISVGSEDLYRDSPLGIAAKEFAGAGPNTLLKYIKTVRQTIKGTCLSDAPVGHVDTWTAYVNETNLPFIEACDWVGMDAYPYYESTVPNAIDEARGLFQTALDNTRGAAGDIPIWITETGYPVSGKKSGDAVASTKNARTFWEEVGCPLFGETNTWWYTLQDSNSDKARDDDTPSFGVIDNGEVTTKPRYNLSCKGVDTKPETKPVSSSAVSKPTSSAKSDEKDESTKSESPAKQTSSSAEESGAQTTASPPSPTASGSDDTEGDAEDDSGNAGGNSGDDSSEGDATDGSETEGSESPSTESTVPEGSAPGQVKGSYGAAVVALVLAFYAI